MIFKRRNYIFTSKSRSRKGILSSVCGIISLVSFFISMMGVIRDGGQAAGRMGAVGFIACLFCVAGIVLGIMALTEKDKFMFFPRLGFTVSIISGIAWGGILYAGIAGIG